MLIKNRIQEETQMNPH